MSCRFGAGKSSTDDECRWWPNTHTSMTRRGLGTGCRSIRPVDTHNEQLIGMSCPCVFDKNGSSGLKVYAMQVLCRARADIDKLMTDGAALSFLGISLWTCRCCTALCGASADIDKPAHDTATSSSLFSVGKSSTGDECSGGSPLGGCMPWLIWSANRLLP